MKSIPLIERKRAKLGKILENIKEYREKRGDYHFRIKNGYYNRLVEEADKYAKEIKQLNK